MAQSTDLRRDAGQRARSADSGPSRPHPGTWRFDSKQPLPTFARPATTAQGATADLVAGHVNVIAAVGGNLAVRAAKKETSDIPIVFITGSDPVEAGLVASLARPAGNLTGVTTISTELNPKRLELLSDLVPEAKVIALLVSGRTGVIQNM